MKIENISSLIWGIGVMSVCLCSCSDDGDAPVSLDEATVSYTPKPGAVRLEWEIPENADYHYVGVDYTLPDGSNHMKSASIYADTLLVDGLLKRYGPIDFTLYTVSRDGVRGSSCIITAQADAAPATTVITDEVPLTLSADGLWTDDQETSEGPIENLIDGSTDTYFHMSWMSPSPFPHYIVVRLPKAVNAFKFSYTNRNNANRDNPGSMEVYVSNREFDGETYDPEAQGGVLVSELSELPDGQGSTYNSDNFILDGAFQYVWFKITSSVSGSEWIALGELSISELTVEINDPEAE